jgi:excisionase family DNA binding protein
MIEDSSVLNGSADRWMRTPEAANYLGVGKSQLHRLAAAGSVPHEQEAPGCALYFRAADLDAWRRNGGRRGS